MSNPAVVKLEKRHVNNSIVWVDDNFGESIHIHIDDMRVDLTVQEFRNLNDDLCEILNDLLQIDHFDVSKIDPVYLSLWLWPKLSIITHVEIENVFLEDMLVRTMDGKKVVELKESVEIKALNQENNENDHFYRKSNHIGQTDTQRLTSILDSIKKNGYPYDGKYITMFSNGNLIRDGQHRASCLYYLYGNIEVPIMRIYFQGDENRKKRFYHNRLFLNSKIGNFLMRTKTLLSSIGNKYYIKTKLTIKKVLKKNGIKKYMVEKNMYRIDLDEIDGLMAR